MTTCVSTYGVRADPTPAAITLRKTRRRTVRTVFVVLLAGTVMAAGSFAVAPRRADALAIGADSNPSGRLVDFHIWFTISDRDIAQAGSTYAVGARCAAAAAETGPVGAAVAGVACGAIVDYIFRHYGRSVAANHGFWGAYYPFHYQHLQIGRW